jgi:type I restriction enzyme S subunit
MRENGESAKGWQPVKFGDVVHNVKINIEPETSDLERYVAGEHMQTDDLHIRSWGTIGDGYLGPAFHRKFVKGQVLYGSRRTYLRKVAVAEFDGICANTTFVLEPKDDCLLSELLPFIMSTEAFHTHSIKNSKGSVNPYVNWKDIASYEFALPPKEEQRRIAEILWAADEVVVKWESSIQQAEITKSVCRLSFFDNTQGWEERNLGDLFEVQLGKMLSPKARRGVSPRPYLGNANVQWGRFDLTDVKKMDFDEKEFEKFALQPGDLLVCEGGEVGRSAIWWEEIENCCYQKALHRLRPLTDEVSPELLLQFMFYAAEQGEFASLTGHTTIAHLTAVKLRKLRVPISPQEVEGRMIKLFKQFDTTIEDAKKNLFNVRELKNKLTNRLLNGESNI